MSNEQLFEKIALLLQAYFDTKEVQTSKATVIETKEEDTDYDEPLNIISAPIEKVEKENEEIEESYIEKLKKKKKKFVL